MTQESMIDTAGIVDGMPTEMYHGDPCPTPALSNGIIKPLLQKSPYHAFLQHPRLNPHREEEQKKEFDIGTAAHAMLLEGADRCKVIDAPDWRTNAAKAARDDAYAAGLTPLLGHQYQGVATMTIRARQFLEQTEFAGVLSRGKSEQSFFWQDLHGIWCKGRMDFVTHERDLILDYKTTGLTPAKWERAMTDHGYDTQSVFYRRGMSVLGHHRCRFVFLVQESCEPYSCWLVEASESLIELASMKVARATRLWAECLRQQRWPSYPTTVQLAQATNWAMQEEEAMQ